MCFRSRSVVVIRRTVDHNYSSKPSWLLWIMSFGKHLTLDASLITNVGQLQSLNKNGKPFLHWQGTYTNSSPHLYSHVFLITTTCHDDDDPSVYPQCMTIGMAILTGESSSSSPSAPSSSSSSSATVQNDINEIATASQVDPELISTITESLATLFWEFSKCPPRVINTGNNILLQTGLSVDVVDAFMATFQANKATIAQLKQSFSANKASYQGLAWRLDVELGRRNMHVLAEPTYMVRLDLKQPSNSQPQPSTATSQEDNDGHTTPHTAAASSTVQSYHLQADYANMKKLQDELQRAVDSLNSAHCQRLSRYIS